MRGPRRSKCMHHPVVKGSYYDMGYNYGSILYKHNFRVPKQSTEKLEFSRKSESEVKRVFPEILEEIKGFSDACHSPYEEFGAFIFCIGAFKYEPECSVFASHDESDVVFGRNYDFFYSLKDVTESCLALPKDGYYSLGHSDVFIGKEDGINEKGLAIGMTGVDSKGNKPGISFILAIRCVLDKCANVTEALKVLSHAHFTSTYNFLLADKEADLAVIEAAPEKVTIRRPEEGEKFIVCTNHFVHPDMTRFEDIKARCWDSVPRYNAIYDSLMKRNGRINIENAQEILSNHTGYVCSHQEKIKLGTLWSIVARLKKLEILRAEGHPCKTKYKEDSRLNRAVQKRQKPSNEAHI
jgi:predicted choloylglycine hydrolase